MLYLNVIVGVINLQQIHIERICSNNEGQTFLSSLDHKGQVAFIKQRPNIFAIPFGFRDSKAGGDLNANVKAFSINH